MNLPAPQADEPETSGRNNGSADGPTAAGIDRRRLDEIFGDVLPESTRDDRDNGGESGGLGDSWFTENRPPHHGG